MLALSFIGGIPAPSRRKPKGEEEEDYLFPMADVVFPPNIAWIAPVRTKPKRTYNELSFAFSPEGDHTPYLIRRMLGSRTDAKKFQSFIRRVGKASGLFQDVKTKNFGRGATAPFEVDIVLDGKELSLNTVGYGVSQSLPVLVEILARPHGSWLAIQQPEVHLHPRAQAALGDVLFEMATREHKHFLVETHSDFTIDRFRMQYRNRGGNKPDSQVLFFERKNRCNVVTPLSIGPEGELPEKQPKAYRDFFLKESLDVLGI